MNSTSWHNIIYIIIWAIVSMVSSFNGVLEGDFSFICTGDFYKDLMTPLLVWVIAFFADYVYTISALDRKKQELDVKWTQNSYIFIGLIFVILLLSIRLQGEYARTIWVVALFLCMMGLKTASLFVVRPVVRLAAV